MVNILNCYLSMLHKMMKLAGMQPKEIEVEPGTILHFWVNTHNTINNTNISTNNNDENDKKKPSVVLLHGFAGDGILSWQFQILALRKKYSLFVPDLLFFGGSHTTKNERSTKFQADCLAKGLRKLGVEEKCVVVGFSYGGFVGFEMARYYPELVGSLVVSGSLVALNESASNMSLKNIGFDSWQQFLMPNSAEGVKVLLKVGSYNLPPMPDFFYKHYLEIMFSNRKERNDLLEALVVKDEDITNHQFQQCIYLLWGEEDMIFTMEMANNMKEKLGANAELHTIKKAGHLALLESPCVFNKSLRKILHSLAM